MLSLEDFRKMSIDEQLDYLQVMIDDMHATIRENLELRHKLTPQLDEQLRKRVQ